MKLWKVTTHRDDYEMMVGAVVRAETPEHVWGLLWNSQGALGGALYPREAYTIEPLYVAGKPGVVIVEYTSA